MALVPENTVGTPEAFLDAIRESGEALGHAALRERFPEVPKRTAQRWLRKLVEEGHLRHVGAGPSTAYVAIAPSVAPDAFADIPLAPDAREVLRLVRRPLSERTPVGYQRAWVEDYVPGKSWLLPPSARRRLAVLGDTGRDGRPAGTYGREILQRLLIDLSWASSHLEGNTYTRLDTRELLEHGRHADGREAFETQMILNHKAAIELLVEEAGTLRLDRHTVQGIHALLSENLLPDRVDEGRLRQRMVLISGSVYRPPDIPSVIEECLDAVLARESQIQDPFEQSFFLLMHIPYLQPFADVNKRTGRILANLPLVRHNLCPLTFLDVARDAYALAMLGVYELARPELLRDLYVWAYERSAQEYLALRQTMAPPDPLRLRYRDFLRAVVRDIVRSPGVDAQLFADAHIAEEVAPGDREAMADLVMDELRRLHEGTLARYGLRVSEWERWKQGG